VIASVAWCIAALGVAVPVGVFAVAAVLAVRWGRRRMDRTAAVDG
jgi:hypothetical protein